MLIALQTIIQIRGYITLFKKTVKSFPLLISGSPLMSDQSQQFSVEKRILMAMRKTLGNVVKDVTPSSNALKSPLSESTIEDIKMCFGLIAAREQEIAKEAGVEITERPQYVDDADKSNVVSLDSLTKK